MLNDRCVLLRIWPLKDMEDLLHDQRLLELWVQFLYSKSSAWFSMWSMVLYFKCLMSACTLKDIEDLRHDQRLIELWVQFLYSKSSAWFLMWSMVLYFKCLMNACTLKDKEDLLHDQRLIELWVQFLYSKSSAWFSMWSMVLYFKCLMNACVLLRTWPLKDIEDLLHDQRLIELWVQFLYSKSSAWFSVWCFILNA